MRRDLRVGPTVVVAALDERVDVVVLARFFWRSWIVSDET